MSLTDLIQEVITRITFSYGLYWQKDEESPIKLKTEGDLVFFADKFKFDENRKWLEIKLIAPAEADPRSPHIKLNIRLPFPIDDPDYDFEALTTTNEMNLSGSCCSAIFNFKDRCIHINSSICYTGYQDQIDLEVDHSHAQGEATLNWLCSALNLADEWEPWIYKLARTKHITARTVITQKNSNNREKTVV